MGACVVYCVCCHTLTHVERMCVRASWLLVLLSVHENHLFMFHSVCVCVCVCVEPFVPSLCVLIDFHVQLNVGLSCLYL